MDLEQYAARIRSLPIERLYALVEADPEAAVLWSERTALLADIRAAACHLAPDPTAGEALLDRLMRMLYPEAEAQKRGTEGERRT